MNFKQFKNNPLNNGIQYINIFKVDTVHLLLNMIFHTEKMKTNGSLL